MQMNAPKWTDGKKPATYKDANSVWKDWWLDTNGHWGEEVIVGGRSFGDFLLLREEKNQKRVYWNMGICIKQLQDLIVR